MFGDKTMISIGTAQFNGKTIVCFGDSITGCGKYPAKIAARLGVLAYNAGFGHSRMAYHNNTDHDKFSMTKLADAVVNGDFTAQRLAAESLKNNTGGSIDNTEIVAGLEHIDFNNVDIITIFYGTNDFNAGINIGADNDSDSTTFKGAINHIISTILNAYPSIKLLFITPFWSGKQAAGDGRDSDIYPNDNGVFLVEYADAIIRTANLNHIPVLDLYRNSMINKYNGAVYLADLLHPNDTGDSLIANKIAGFLSSIY